MGWDRLHKELKIELGEKQWEKLDNKLWIIHELKIKTKFEPQIQYILNGFYGSMWTSSAFFADFCINVLNCNCDRDLWKILQALVVNCGWIFPFEQVCCLCARPRKIALNYEDELHNLQDTAIEYSDGSGIYADHGVILPEKYGKVHPSQWQSQWLLSEKK